MFTARREHRSNLLAAGAAHDFNHWLGLVMGHAALARAKLPTSSPVHDDLDAIDTAAEKMAHLCQLMLACASRRRLKAQPVDLNRLAQDTVMPLRTLWPRTLAVHYEWENELPPVRGDETLLRQVVQNLVVNAAEAIGDAGGTITVQTTRCERSVLLEVIDDGPGMSDDTRRKIFEPFFTTKRTGHGLGLAVVAAIVKRHRGKLRVISDEGCGTQFRVRLPRW